MSNLKISKEYLVDFESRVAHEFNNALIPHPVHLSSGNEQELIEIFQEVGDRDWIFCSWRSHLHALLRGVPEADILHSIRNGYSISLCFPKYNFYSSGIVGGQIPIALGAALAVKRAGGDEHIWCFVGDMTSETGIANSSIKYAMNNGLPISFVIEDNGLSVCTNTLESWNLKGNTWEPKVSDYIRYYRYDNSYPHAGAGMRVQF